MFDVRCFLPRRKADRHNYKQDRSLITNHLIHIRQAYENKTHFEEHPKMDFVRNSTRVIRGNNRAVYRLLEVN